MNPNYTFVIRTTIGMHKHSRNVEMAFKRYLDFVPVIGTTIKFTNDDNEELMIEILNIHYDYYNKQFVEEQEDDTLLEELREPDRTECTVLPARLQEYIDFYKSFGWELI